MKRAVRTLLICLSMILLLTVPVLPHHHHQGAECAVVERCAHDNAYNDKHTDHYAKDKSGRKTLCVQSLMVFTKIEVCKSALLFCFVLSLVLLAYALRDTFAFTKIGASCFGLVKEARSNSSVYCSLYISRAPPSRE